MVNKINWQKTGHVTEPGRYMLTFGWLTVTADDLAVWDRYPDASFTLVEILTEPDAPDEYRLGTFELPPNALLNQS
ncbi:MAG TPA: hypothetical protein VII39_06475 [Bradyrhizobium sp.]